MAETVQERLRATKLYTSYGELSALPEEAYEVIEGLGASEAFFKSLSENLQAEKDTLIKERDEARESERERCTAIVDNMRRLLSHEYTDPNPQYNTVAKAREFAAMMAEISLDAIRDGHISDRALLPPTAPDSEVHNDGGMK